MCKIHLETFGTKILLAVTACGKNFFSEQRQCFTPRHTCAARGQVIALGLNIDSAKKY